jgi:hypothetical protein
MARGVEKTYDLEELQGRYPSLKTLAAPASKACETAWVYAFKARPEAVEDLIADIIKQAYAKPGRIGQRPMPKEEEVNLEALLHGEYADDLIHLSLPPLIKISQRAFCTKIHMNRRMFQRLLLSPGSPDKYFPDMHMLSRIASAVSKPPSYFLEWRQMAAQAAFIQLITDKPGVATRLYRDFLTSEKRSPFLNPPR